MPLYMCTRRCIIAPHSLSGMSQIAQPINIIPWHDLRPLSLPVLLGVLGGMAATAVLVFICVPLVRRRTRSQQPRAKRSAAVQASPRATSDVEKGYGHGHGYGYGYGYGYGFIRASENRDQLKMF